MEVLDLGKVTTSGTFTSNLLKWLHITGTTQPTERNPTVTVEERGHRRSLMEDKLQG